ncbi:MAG: hypothetical protein WBK28_03020 [Minisyncoccia bacterium]
MDQQKKGYMQLGIVIAALFLLVIIVRSMLGAWGPSSLDCGQGYDAPIERCETTDS